MLDSDIELLTAFVDGELNSRERKAVLRLLHKSSEARGLLWQLRDNAIAVQQLPAKSLPADFAATIVKAIEQTATPSPSTTELAQPAPKPGLGRRVLARFAMAAALLLAVGGAILYYGNTPPEQNIDIAKYDQGPDDKFTPKPHVTNVVRPPGYFAFRDLKDKGQVKALAKELTKPAGDRVELTVSNSAKAVHKIHNVLKNHGIQVFEDKSVQASAKSGKPAEYWVFAESSSPEEMAELLGRMGHNEGFDGVQVLAMSGDDRKNLSKVMGIDAEQLRNPREPLKLLDPIPMGGTTGKDAKTSAPPSQPRPERFALIVAANTASGAQPSQQIQQFLSQRRKLPGTVQVLLVVRQI